MRDLSSGVHGYHVWDSGLEPQFCKIIKASKTKSVDYQNGTAYDFYLNFLCKCSFFQLSPRGVNSRVCAQTPSLSCHCFVCSRAINRAHLNTNFFMWSGDGSHLMRVTLAPFLGTGSTTHTILVFRNLWLSKSPWCKTDTVEMLEGESRPYRGDNTQQTLCEGHAAGGWEQGECWNIWTLF